MGDLCDMSDIDEFMRSPGGQAHLEEVQKRLMGRTIEAVYFGNQVQWLSTVLYLDDGSLFEVLEPEHDVGALRETFAEAINRQYEQDYPERRRG